MKQRYEYLVKWNRRDIKLEFDLRRMWSYKNSNWNYKTTDIFELFFKKNPTSIFEYWK